jgi:hypothetical protein
MLRTVFQFYYKEPGMNPSGRAVKRFIRENNFQKQQPMKVENAFKSLKNN